MSETRGRRLFFAGLLACGGVILYGLPLTVAAEEGASVPPAAVTPPAGGGPVLVLPRAQAAPLCGDVLAQSGLRLPELEFLFCRREGTEEAARLVARYRVRGAQAASVEAALQRHCGMAALQRTAGIWSLPQGGEGRLAGALFGPEAGGGDGDRAAEARVSMGEVPQERAVALGREQWGGIAWFSVRVELPCLPRP